MDSFWLGAAFFQASRVIGVTGKNPPVGCILVKNEEVIGIGATSLNGRPHAEENAIAMAGIKAKGSTMYVTLEPCNIENNKKSCAKLIISSGIKKVIIGMLDPNPATFKKGFKELIKNGVEARVEKISLNNFLLHYAHYSHHINKRPLIALKLGTSINGKITNEANKSKWITSKFARSHVQQLRSAFDSILVGTKTLLLDNPNLTTRIDGFKKNNIRIVFDKALKISLKSNLLKSIKKNPLIIITNKREQNPKYKKLLDLGVILCKIKLNKKKYLDLDQTINALNSFNVRSILVEGGSITASEFLEHNMVDIIYIYRSNSFIGAKSLNMLNDISYNRNFELYHEVNLEREKFEVWVNKKIMKLKIIK